MQKFIIQNLLDFKNEIHNHNLLSLIPTAAMYFVYHSTTAGCEVAPLENLAPTRFKMHSVAIFAFV